MFTIRKITFVLAWMIILVFPGALKTVHADEAVYKVVPRITWSLSKDKSAMYVFTFGDGVYAFLFDPVNAEGREYLEFDVYIPDAEVIDRWKTGETEFEITSSGTCDINEYAWSGFDLWRQAAENGLRPAEGWNHVKLSLPGGSAADLSNINYIRWYWNDDSRGRAMEGLLTNLTRLMP